MLHDFISLNRASIIERCRVKAASRLSPTPAESELDEGIPLFLEEVVDALRHQDRPRSEVGRSAALHGRDLLKRGFTVRQVVHDYGDVCQSITEIAVDTEAPITADEFRTLNGCLDVAIADAVTAYSADCRESAAADDNARGVRFGFFIHELRNLVQTATFASEALLSGNVGVTGSTAAVLRRSLTGVRALVNTAIADVRVSNGAQHPEIFSVVQFVQELADAAGLEADSRNLTLQVISDEQRPEVRGDRHHLAAAVNNLLQNAMKFTRRGSTVTLRTAASVDRVFIEVQDECGGLPEGKSAELFHPFEQRGSDRTGLGLGLAYSQWAVVANGGRLYVRNSPPSGCTFVADLPRHQADSPATDGALPTQEMQTRRRSTDRTID